MATNAVGLQSCCTVLLNYSTLGTSPCGASLEPHAISSTGEVVFPIRYGSCLRLSACTCVLRSRRVCTPGRFSSAPPFSELSPLGSKQREVLHDCSLPASVLCCPLLSVSSPSNSRQYRLHACTTSKLHSGGLRITQGPCRPSRRPVTKQVHQQACGYAITRWETDRFENTDKHAHLQLLLDPLCG